MYTCSHTHKYIHNTCVVCIRVMINVKSTILNTADHMWNSTIRSGYQTCMFLFNRVWLVDKHQSCLHSSYPSREAFLLLPKSKQTATWRCNLKKSLRPVSSRPSLVNNILSQHTHTHTHTHTENRLFPSGTRPGFYQWTLTWKMWSLLDVHAPDKCPCTCS